MGGASPSMIGIATVVRCLRRLVGIRGTDIRRDRDEGEAGSSHPVDGIPGIPNRYKALAQRDGPVERRLCRRTRLIGDGAAWSGTRLGGGTVEQKFCLLPGE